jgi:hypothetical protein
MRHYDDVVQIGADPAIGSGTASGLGCNSCGLSDVVGSHPEREANHGTTLNARALIGGGLSRLPACVIRRRQLVLEGLMSCHDMGTVSIWGEEIDAHAPEFCPVTYPAHGPDVSRPPPKW